MSEGRYRRWIPAGALALALLLLLPWPGDGPRYRGRSFGHWFPRWEPMSHDWLDERLTPLKQAGPEALPVLLAGLEATDNAFDAGSDDYDELTSARQTPPTAISACTANMTVEQIARLFPQD